MRRAAFIKQNKDRWKEFETLVNTSGADPDQLADLFIQVSDDLAYSATQYPNTDTTQYLNNLASKLHLKIYKNKKEEKSRFRVFWTQELPLLFYTYRRALIYSFLIFGLSVLIGALSAANDESFVRLILGDAYVNMTIQNIEKGEPMGVYGTQGELSMFFGITLNNIRVSFLTFIWGGYGAEMPLFLFLSFGTAYILFQNGVMVGAFQYFFYEYGLLKESALTIWLHGTIEIASIIIAGAAGIIAGNSILFPGTYRRIDSLKKGIRDGMKIIIGLIPLFIIAGFIEGYITRKYEMPDALKGTIILLSLAFMIYYVVILPNKLAKKNGLY